MPKRTNARQMVVHFVRKQYAGPGVVVTESKMLRDAVTGEEVEVDVVIEGSADGDPFVTSIEVVDRSRPAGRPWVQEMVKKHDRLPTNKLLLVSWSGFSKPALTAVEKEGGNVHAIQPQTIECDGAPLVNKLFVDQIRMDPNRCDAVLMTAASELSTVGFGPDIEVHDETHQVRGQIGHLAREIVNLPQLRKRLMVDAHEHRERDSLKGFTVVIGLHNAPFFVHHLESDQWHHIEALQVSGDFGFEQRELLLTAADLDGRRFAFGESKLLGRDTVWVATPNAGGQTSTLSWRTTDNQPLITGVAPPRRFPELDAIPLAFGPTPTDPVDFGLGHVSGPS